MAWALLLGTAAGCGAGHYDPPDAEASNDAAHDAGHDAGIDAGRPCPNPPAIIGTHELGRVVTGTAVQGENVLVTSGTLGGTPSLPALLVLDASDPASIVLVSELYPDLNAGTVLWVDDRAVFSLSSRRPHDYVVLDMTSPRTPVEIGVLPDHQSAVHLAPPFAIGGSQSELLVFDIAEASPTIVARTAVPGAWGLVSMAVGERTAFLVDETIGEDRGIHAIDISDPTAPEYAGVVVPPAMLVGDYLQPLPGELLYYREEGELRLLDVADPANARLLGTVDLPEGSLPVLLAANLIFFRLPDPDAPEGAIMGIAPLEDPLEPRIEWTVRMPGPWALWPEAVSDGLAYSTWVTESPSEDVLVVVDLGCAVQ